MLHVRVLLVATMDARHVVQSRADQHQSRVPSWERPHHAGPAANLAVQPLDHVVGAGARSTLTGKSAVSQRLLNTIFDLLLQFYCSQLGQNGLQRSRTLVVDDKLHAVQTAPAKPRKEAAHRWLLSVLITFLLNCTIFSDIICCFSSDVRVGTLSYPSLQTMPFSFCATHLILILPAG